MFTFTNYSFDHYIEIDIECLDPDYDAELENDGPGGVPPGIAMGYSNYDLGDDGHGGVQEKKDSDEPGTPFFQSNQSPDFDDYDQVWLARYRLFVC
jgi:hypothetical protein